MFGKSIHEVHERNGYRFIKISGESSSDIELVMLHGMFGGLSNYDPLLKEVDGCTVYVPSIPVYEADPVELTIPRLSRWLYGFCNHMNLHAPVLLGNSMGGHIALDYAVQFPDSVSALVLTGSSGLLEREFGSSCPRRNDRNYIREQAALTFYDDLIDDVILDEIMDVITTPAKLRNLLVLARSTHEYNMENLLADILHPVLLVWGRNDIITPPEVAETFCRNLPNARLRWISKCGHAPMMEHPKTFALFLDEFLTELKDKFEQNIRINHEKDHSYL